MANFTLLSLLGDQLHGLDRARLVCLSEKNLQPCSKGQLKLFNDCSLLWLNSLWFVTNSRCRNVPWRIFQSLHHWRAFRCLPISRPSSLWHCDLLYWRTHDDVMLMSYFESDLCGIDSRKQKNLWRFDSSALGSLWMSSACIRSQYFCFTSTKMFFWCCGRVNEWLNVTELQKTTLEMPLANTSSFLWQYSWQVVCKSAWRERRQILCSQQRQHYLKALTNQIGSVTIYNTIESSAKLSNTY